MTTTVGILGGGQLARMMVLAGAPMGLRFQIFEPSADACAAQLAPLHCAEYSDDQALEKFAKQIDVATFDFENVPAECAQHLSQLVAVFPAAKALSVSQDRLAEKKLFRELGMGTPNFVAVDSLQDLQSACVKIGFPCVLKTRRLGYDGKGQYRLKAEQDIELAWNALKGAALILESFVHFEAEVSQVAVRAQNGEFRAYPLTRNWHIDGVLAASLAPAKQFAHLSDAAQTFCQKLAESLDYVGVFAVEFFIENNRLLVNEMAPRVHNSGHWTIEGAVCSQFENHLRAVLGLPLGDVSAKANSVMFNWIGSLPDAQKALAIAGLHWHDYGKTSRAGRKVGHATIVESDKPELASRIAQIANELDRQEVAALLLSALHAQ